MRPLLKGYVALIGVLACALFVRELLALSRPLAGTAAAAWPHAWSIELALALFLLTALGEHLQFEIRRGWNTNCSGVAHLAAAFLLPPPLAMAIAAFGALTRAVRYPLPPTKLAFNAASIALAVLAACALACSIPLLIGVGAVSGLGAIFGGWQWFGIALVAGAAATTGWLIVRSRRAAKARAARGAAEADSCGCGTC